MRIRSFIEHDRASVVELWRATGLTRPWNDPNADVDRAIATWPALFLIAEESEAVVGTALCGYDGHRGWIYYVAVDPANQRSGIGRALIDEAEFRLRALGCPKVMLMVRRDNSAAGAFYDRLGYTPNDVATFGKRLVDD